jgi:hypothetical protein
MFIFTCILDKSNLYVSVSQCLFRNSEVFYILDVNSTKSSLLIMYNLVRVYPNVLSNFTFFVYTQRSRLRVNQGGGKVCCV